MHLWRREDQPAFGAAAAIPGDVISLMFPRRLSCGKAAEFNILHGVCLFDHVQPSKNCLVQGSCLVSLCGDGHLQRVLLPSLLETFPWGDVSRRLNTSVPLTVGKASASLWHLTVRQVKVDEIKLPFYLEGKKMILCAGFLHPVVETATFRAVSSFFWW